MTSHLHEKTELTKNQSLVLDALTNAEGSLSAYTILDRLRGEGFRAPLQVYRALDKLVELGMVHRLETLNAFVICRQPECDGHNTAAFTICRQCENVAELPGDQIAGTLKSMAERAGFTLDKSIVELEGVCADCSSG